MRDTGFLHNFLKLKAFLVLGMFALLGAPVAQAITPVNKKQPEARSTAAKAESASPPPAASEPETAPAAPVDPIVFAGIWMAGPEADWERRFPVGKELAMTRRVASEDAAKSFELSKQLLEDLRRFQKENPGGGRIVDALAEVGYQPRAESGSALVMACVLNYEYSYTRKVGRAVAQRFAEVGFDLVICDFSNLSVVATFPYRIERIGSMADKERDMLRQIYLGIENEKLTFSQAKPTFQNIYTDNNPSKPMKEARPATLREGFLNMAKTPVKALSFEKVAVRNVRVDKEAKEALDPYFLPTAEEYFGWLFASNFCEGTTLREKNPKETDKLKRRLEYQGTGVACLPYSKGNEVVYSMMVDELADAFRVRLRSREEAESKNVKFSLGSPAYDADLVLPGFVANPIPAGIQFCAYSRIELKVDGHPIYSRQHDGNDIAFAGVERKWSGYAAATNTMFFEAGFQILRAATGNEINKANPVQIVKPSLLKNFFLMCAPDCAKTFK